MFFLTQVSVTTELHVHLSLERDSSRETQRHPIAILFYSSFLCRISSKITMKKNHHYNFLQRSYAAVPTFLVFFMWMVKTSTSFSPSSSSSWTTTTATSLQARAGKRGSLGTLAQEGLVDVKKKAPSRKKNKTKKTQSSSSNKKTTTTTATDGSISPDLAKWMNQQQREQSQATKDEDDDTAVADGSRATTAATTTFTAFDEENDDENTSKKQKQNPRRLKQTQRSQLEDSQRQEIGVAVEALQTILQGKNNLPDILTAIRNLLQLTPLTTSPKSILTGTSSTKDKNKKNFRLAWVGSDEAICHIGTGLHKVPLARLQEVFWCCCSSKASNRFELLEVISILGPFPNVRNTLQGSWKVVNTNGSSTSSSSLSMANLQITMDSMVDGTGKELLAGTEENIRKVSMDLAFWDERVLVMVVPTSTTNNDDDITRDPLDDNGSNVLVFLQEPQLDEKLDALRVS